MKYVIITILSFLLSFNVCYANEITHEDFHKNTINNVVINHNDSHIHSSVPLLKNIEKGIKGKITQITESVEKTKSPKVILIGILFALLFGMFHALGPGYGKTVMFTYFLFQKEELWKIPLMGLQIATTHILSAIILVIIASTSIKSFIPSEETQMLYLKLVSYAFITLIGIYMIVSKAKHIECSCCSHSHVKPGSLAISTGLVPCPGTMLILLLSMAHNVLWLGVILVFFKGIGIALTLSIVGLFGAFGNKKVENITLTNSKWITPIEFIGPILITIIGFLLFIATVL